jgi:hypothetical protein
MSSSISGISIAPVLARPTSSKKSAGAASSASAAAGATSTGKGGKSKNKAAASFLSQIEQAVTNALQSAKQSDASDPNDIVQSAIEQVFSQGSPPDAATANAEASNLALQNGGTADAAHSAFLQALKANGIDPEQFKTDFLSAVKEAKNGVGNVATALKNLPPGSLLDTTA